MKMHEITSELRRLAYDIENRDKRPLMFGEIMQKLRELISRGKERDYITFDWGCAWPTGFESYRGDYSQICMEYGGEHRHHETVEGLLKKMQGLIGSELTGWKGGEYTVEPDKEVYVCCAGCTSSTRVVDVVAGYYGATICTAQFEE